MSDFVALALFLYAGVLTLVGAVRVAVTTRADRPSSSLRPGLIALAVGLALQAIGHVVGMALGHAVGRPAVQAAYLVASVLLVPAGLMWAGDDRGRWGYAVLALTALISAVLIVRVQTTWRPGHG